jgi:hypothetical protein
MAAPAAGRRSMAKDAVPLYASHGNNGTRCCPTLTPAISPGKSTRRICGASVRTRRRKVLIAGRARPERDRRCGKDWRFAGSAERRMTIRYHVRGELLVPEYLCQQEGIARAEPPCQRIPGAGIDAAVGQLLMEAVTPVALEVALAVQQELQSRWQESDRLRQTQGHRARYEATLAQRRYLQVDPLCALRSYVTFGPEMLTGGPLPRFQGHITTRISGRPSGPRLAASVSLVWSCLSLRSAQARQPSSPDPLPRRYWWYRAKHDRARRGSC